MLPVWMALGGAGLGLAKGAMDQKQEERDRKLAAETIRYSPWTGMQAQPIKRADMLGSVMQGGMTGASLGQGINQYNNQEALTQAQTDYYNRSAPQMAAPRANPYGNASNYNPWNVG